MSDDRGERVTQPMMETLLNRLQGIDNKIDDRFTRVELRIDGLRTEMNELRTEMNELRTEVNGLRTEMGELRVEMNKNFSRVTDEIAILSEDTVKTRASQRELRRRIDELEPKAS